MPYKPGQSGNPKGRPKGSKHRATFELRERVKQLLDDQFDQVVDDLTNLDPKERVNAWLRLLEYALPKLQRTETTIDFSSLTDQQVDALIDQITKQLDR